MRRLHHGREWGEPTRALAVQESRAPLFSKICSRLARRLKPGARVLDVGASFGGLLVQAKELGFSGYAVEITDEAAGHLERQGFPVYREGNLAGLQDEGFDAICMIDVNYYFEDQSEEITQALRLLKPGGVLIIRTTNKSLYLKAGLFLRWFFPAFAASVVKRSLVDHLLVLDAEALALVLRNAGFRNLRIEPDTDYKPASAAVFALYAFGNFFHRLTGFAGFSPGVIIWAER